MAKVRVGDYIANFFYQMGIKRVFMLAGTGSIYLDDGIAKHPHLRPISFCNEAVGPMMAAAYARANKEAAFGVAYVTTGPGGANAISGVTEAWVDSSPIVVISGQARSDQTSYSARKQGRHLRTYGIQELDIISLVKHITKYAAVVERPEDILLHLQKAIYTCTEGRPGPVWLDIPFEVQCAEVEESELRQLPPSLAVSGRNKSTFDAGLFYKFFELLRDAKRPVIVLGQGIKIAGAEELVREFVDRANIPVVATRFGTGVLPFSYNKYFGCAGVKGHPIANNVLLNSDLIIALGTRLAPAFIGEDRERISSSAKIVMVDIDESELSKSTPTLCLPCDVEAFLLHLLACYEESSFSFREWLPRCREYKEELKIDFEKLREKKGPIDFYYFVHCLEQASKPKSIFVNDAGTSYYICGQALEFEKAQKEITSGTYASMGVAIPLAIGAAVGDPSSQVLAIVGDGSIETNIQELKTLSVYKPNVKVFVINNGGYVSIRESQDHFCEGRYIDSDQGNLGEVLNFKRVAKAFSLPFFRLSGSRELETDIKVILAYPGPCLVEVVCDSNQKVLGPL